MEMKDQILTSAQRLVQQRGFNGFSYADVAAEVGIRKASLHHHFPSKANLGLALIEGYTARLNHELVRIDGLGMSTKEKLEAYTNIYRGTLEADCICMGGMLASETLTLDDAMLPSLKRFFALNTEWLTEVLTEGASQQLFALKSSADNHARLFLSTLQGALLVARATGEHDAFDQTASLLISNLIK